MCSKNALYGETDREVNVLTELKKKRRKGIKKKSRKKEKRAAAFYTKSWSTACGQNSKIYETKTKRVPSRKKKEKKRSTETTNW